MSKFEFIDSLHEARMLRRLSRVRGESVPALTKRLFNHLLALRIIYAIKPAVAQKYTRETLQHSHFKSFLPSSTDLYNLIVLIIQQYEYADQLFNDWKIVLPEMRLRRVLRSIEAGKLDHSDYNELMLIIQRKTALDGYQITMRRVVADFEKAPASQKIQHIKRLVLLMREDTVQSDLYIILKNIVEQTEL